MNNEDQRIRDARGIINVVRQKPAGMDQPADEDVAQALSALLDYIDEQERVYEGGVLPLRIDDGTVINCASISGGADSTNGEPNRLTIAIRQPDGSEQHVQYIRNKAIEDAVAKERGEIVKLIERSPEIGLRDRNNPSVRIFPLKRQFALLEYIADAIRQRGLTKSPAKESEDE